MNSEFSIKSKGKTKNKILRYISMKRVTKHIIVIFVLLIIGGVGNNNASNLNHTNNEHLNYEIVYHWGVIWKVAAKAELLTQTDHHQICGELYARTQPWADKVYRVRDTLQTWMNPADGFMPKRYIKTAHEGKTSTIDTIEFYHCNDSIIGNSVRKRGNNIPQKHRMAAESSAYDMLSVFYYIRTLNFQEMTPGDEIITTIFSGRRKEWLKIRYIGDETIKLRDKQQRQSHHLTLTFSMKNQQNSSAPIDAWLDIDNSHKPLLIRGTLNVGEIRVYYTGN